MSYDANEFLREQQMMVFDRARLGYLTDNWAAVEKPIEKVTDVLEKEDRDALKDHSDARCRPPTSKTPASTRRARLKAQMARCLAPAKSSA